MIQSLNDKCLEKIFIYNVFQKQSYETVRDVICMNGYSLLDFLISKAFITFDMIMLLKNWHKKVIKHTNEWKLIVLKIVRTKTFTELIVYS